jgi:hypothetical protein
MSIRNLPGSKVLPALKAENLTPFCEPLLQKICESRRLTTLWASTACYRDSFTLGLWWQEETSDFIVEIKMQGESGSRDASTGFLTAMEKEIKQI